MSRNSTLILLGILTVLVPFSGLPIAFRTLLAVIFGACVAGIGFALRAREAQGGNTPPPVETPPSEPSTPPVDGML